MAFISLEAAGLLALALLLYNIILILYRWTFHPLARFPGPKLAAASRWWECAQDLFAAQGGDYINQVERMHDEYGPIVRVTPDEVHIKDPEWSHVLYAGPGHLRDKDPSLAHAAGTADGTFGSVSHHVHRRRRIPVSSYFSVTSVRDLQDRIWDCAGALYDVLQAHFNDGTVVNCRATFLGWSNDTLRSCAFGESLNLLGNPAAAMEFDRVFKAFAAVYPVLKQCEWIIPLALKLPIAPVRYLYRPLATLLIVHVAMIEFAKRAQTEYGEMEKQQQQKDISETEGRTATKAAKRFHNLFHALLASSLPQEEKRPERMAHEGFEILLAGSDTTARTMGVAVYHLVANPEAGKRLQDELRSVMPNPKDVVDLSTLESLPWLTSVVKESLRIGKITDHRLSLVCNDETLHYQSWNIPPGTRVSMTPTRNSYDPKFFPNPRDFAPERWLQDEATVAGMNHVFMPFAAGRRGCLGMHFAKAELYTGLARMFRAFEFELVDVVRERDIDHVWAHIAGEPSKQGKGLRVRVARVVD